MENNNNIKKMHFESSLGNNLSVTGFSHEATWRRKKRVRKREGGKGKGREMLAVQASKGEGAVM